MIGQPIRSVASSALVWAELLTAVILFVRAALLACGGFKPSLRGWRAGAAMLALQVFSAWCYERLRGEMIIWDFLVLFVAWPLFAACFVLNIGLPVLYPQILPRWMSDHPMHLLPAVLFLAALSQWAVWLDTDAYLKWNFSRHRDRLETLVTMAREDFSHGGPWSIPPNFNGDGPIWDWGGDSVITRRRTDQYRPLCEGAGVPFCARQTHDEPGAIALVAREGGTWDTGHYEGYLWSERTPVPVPYTYPRGGSSYEELAPHWYLFHWYH